MRDQLSEKFSDVELKKKLLEVNNITLEAAMDKVRKWEASREQAVKWSRQAKNLAQALMQQKEILDVEPK